MFISAGIPHRLAFSMTMFFEMCLSILLITDKETLNLKGVPEVSQMFLIVHKSERSPFCLFRAKRVVFKSDTIRPRIKGYNKL